VVQGRRGSGGGEGSGVTVIKTNARLPPPHDRALQAPVPTNDDRKGKLWEVVGSGGELYPAEDRYLLDCYTGGRRGDKPSSVWNGQSYWKGNGMGVRWWESTTLCLNDSKHREWKAVCGKSTRWRIWGCPAATTTGH